MPNKQKEWRRPGAQARTRAELPEEKAKGRMGRLTKHINGMRHRLQHVSNWLLEGLLIRAGVRHAA